MWKAISFALLSVCCFQWAAPQAIKPKLPGSRPTSGRSHDVARWAGHVADAKLPDRLLVVSARVNDLADAGGGGARAIVNVPDAEDRARAIRGVLVSYGGGCGAGWPGSRRARPAGFGSWQCRSLDDLLAVGDRPGGRSCQKRDRTASTAGAAGWSNAQPRR